MKIHKDSFRNRKGHYCVRKNVSSSAYVHCLRKCTALRVAAFLCTMTLLISGCAAYESSSVSSSQTNALREEILDAREKECASLTAPFGRQIQDTLEIEGKNYLLIREFADPEKAMDKASALADWALEELDRKPVFKSMNAGNWKEYEQLLIEIVGMPPAAENEAQLMLAAVLSFFDIYENSEPNNAAREAAQKLAMLPDDSEHEEERARLKRILIEKVQAYAASQSEADN